MEIKLCTINEIDKIMNIYDVGRNFMRDTGNLNQWINGYPQRELVIEDIRLNKLYGVYENCELIAVFMMSLDSDPTYEEIYDGSWLNNEKYAVIHRIATLVHGKGVAKACYDYALSKCNNLRIDTSKENLVMQRSLQKNGFKYCGVIYLLNGDPRLAYQKIKD